MLKRPLIDLRALWFHEATAELRRTFIAGRYRYLLPDGWQVPPRDRLFAKATV